MAGTYPYATVLDLKEETTYSARRAVNDANTGYYFISSLSHIWRVESSSGTIGTISSLTTLAE